MIQAIGTDRYSIVAMKMADVLRELTASMKGDLFNLPVRDFVRRKFMNALIGHGIKGLSVSTDHPLLDAVIDKNGWLVSFIDTSENKQSFTLIYTPEPFDVPKAIFAAVPKIYYWGKSQCLQPL